MPTPEQLLQNGIYDWLQIRENYGRNPDLLLGNGFTLQFSNQFNYDSLFDVFLSNCLDNDRALFEQFETTNFEQILQYLLYSLKVNQILQLPTEPIQQVTVKLRQGLIATIEQIHPRYEGVNKANVDSIASQLVEFNDIYTTNYDLYLYHIVMRTNDFKREAGGDYISYQDFFWGREAPAGFSQYMDYQEQEYKNIYYLHGALFLFNIDGYICKLKRRTSVELIDTVAERINQNQFPVFISEGNSRDKLTEINNSYYLTLSMDSLKKSSNPILIFGNKLGEIDIHIRHSIQYTRRSIIYCIYVGERNINDIRAEKETFLSYFNNYNHPIEFVDSSTVFEIG